MKLKRFFTGVLSAVMALSVCALPAAAEGTTTGAATTTYTSTIDTSKTGSITIHKYLVKGDLPMGGSNYGEELTDTNNLKEKDGTAYEAAEGVGFSIYKVMNAKELVAYYDGKYEGTEPSATGCTVDADGGYVTLGGNRYSRVGSEQKTTKDGKTTFNELELGLYLVVETTKPKSVTSAVTPFLVSVPMTKVGEDGKTNPTEWLYNIHVYPKNSTKVGDVTLKKMGVVGKKNGANQKGISGVQFILERQNDGTATQWDVISNPKDSASGYYTTGEDGKVTVSGLKPGNYRFVEIGYGTTADDKKYIIDNNGTYEFTIAFDEDSATQTVTQDENSKNKENYDVSDATITIYNYAPDVDKQVKNSHSDDYQVAADYNFGDKINYKVEVTIPANIEKLQNFVLTDTPKYVNDDKESVKVYTDVNKGTELTENAYKVETTTVGGYNGFTITFEPSELRGVAGEKLYVYYTAELAKDGKGDFAGVVTSEGNANAINLKYSNKTSINSADKDKTGNNNEIEDDAVVYTFEISINKKAEKADGKALAGVKFDLYKEVAKNTVGALRDAEKYGFDTSSNGYLLVKKDLVTDNTGKVSYKGLANGNYWLVETQTVDGYNLLGKPIKVELSIAYKTSWKERNTYDTLGKLIKHSREDKKEAFDKDTKADNNGVTVNGGTQSGYTYTVGSDKIGGQETTIINKKGFTLPVTGGFGTLLFSGIGVLLVLAGVAVLFSMKKKNDRA